MSNSLMSPPPNRWNPRQLARTDPNTSPSSNTTSKSFMLSTPGGTAVRSPPSWSFSGERKRLPRRALRWDPSSLPSPSQAGRPLWNQATSPPRKRERDGGDCLERPGWSGLRSATPAWGRRQWAWTRRPRWCYRRRWALIRCLRWISCRWEWCDGKPDGDDYYHNLGY